MKKNKLLGFALIGIGVGVGIYLVKKHNEKKGQIEKIDNRYDDDDDDFFDDDDFYCDTESVEVIKDRYIFVDGKSINEDNIQTKDLKENVKEDDTLIELTNSECFDDCVCEKSEEVKEEIDELTNQLNKETKEEILKQKEKIVLQREELFKKKREGILVGKEFKEMKKALGQEEERLNKILAEMKK